jgi:beta-glucosidase
LNSHFYFFQPFSVDIKYDNPHAINSNDFFGLNYYANQIVAFKLDFTMPFEFITREEDELTDMQWPIYPEGIYRAIKQVNTIGVPIIITENGLADAKDVHRADFFKRYLYAVRKAMYDGYNVQGYMVWSLIDNFEWAKGFRPRFGLYEVDYATQERTLRAGSKSFVDIVARSKA